MLPEELAAAPAIELARGLLGRLLISDVGGERVSGVICETEAYLGVDDPASHAWQGRRRKGHLGIWAPPGSWYVYRSYGIHWCLDLTAGPEGVAGAVLLRGVEPVDGIDVIRRRRGSRVRDSDLTNGPGKLGAAFGVTAAHDGLIADDRCVIRLGPPVAAAAGRTVRITPRIGISRARDWPLRFVWEPAG